MTRPSFSRIILPIVAIVLIAITAFLVMRGTPDRSAQTPAVTPPTTPAAQRESGTVAAAGVIEPASEIVSIATPLPGVVEAVLVRAGERVVAGQPLFRIDQRDAVAAVVEAEARVESARKSAAAAGTSLAVARNQLALYGDVRDPRAVSKLEVIDRRGAVANAQAQLAQARAQMRTTEAELVRARVDVARRTVRAPIAGEVLQVRVRAGEFASAAPGGGGADPLMTLGQTDPLHVRIDIDENEVGRAAIGSAAVISPRGNAARRVEVGFVRVEPQIVPKRSLTNSASERVDVRVLQLIYAVPTGTEGLFVGQQVDAFVPARGVRR